MIKLIKGWLGEKASTLGMWLGLDRDIYRRIDSLIVPASDGTTQVDHVVVSLFGVFVIETKAMKGWIFGSESDRQWTQMIFGEEYRFQNPLHQNLRHIRCLSDFLRLDRGTFHSVIWFIGDCEFKTALPDNVLRDGLCSYLRSFDQELLSPRQVEEAEAALRELKASPPASRREHLRSLEERHEGNGICPRCGAGMVRRTARSGPNEGRSFLGCSGYPACRYIVNLRD